MRCSYAKIYCVEDDESVRELVIYALQSSGFEAQGFVNAEEFFPVLKIMCLI